MSRYDLADVPRTARCEQHHAIDCRICVCRECGGYDGEHDEACSEHEDREAASAEWTDHVDEHTDDEPTVTVETRVRGRWICGVRIDGVLVGIDRYESCEQLAAQLRALPDEAVEIRDRFRGDDEIFAGEPW